MKRGGLVRICEYCNHLVDTIVNTMCPDCRAEYLEIRKLVADTPNITVLEVSRQTGISVRKIQLFTQKGWFIMSGGTVEAFE